MSIYPKNNSQVKAQSIGVSVLPSLCSHIESRNLYVDFQEGAIKTSNGAVIEIFHWSFKNRMEKIKKNISAKFQHIMQLRDTHFAIIQHLKQHPHEAMTYLHQHPTYFYLSKYGEKAIDKLEANFTIDLAEAVDDLNRYRYNLSTKIILQQWKTIVAHDHCPPVTLDEKDILLLGIYAS